MTLAVKSSKFKAFNLFICIFMLFSCLALCSNTPSENENTRFGSPGNKGKKLKRNGYTAMYDGIKKCPIWVAYLLKKENVVNNGVKPGAFKADKDLEPFERTSREDYPSKYDKCPMAPVLDLAHDPKTYAEGFLLSNVCAMNPFLKRFKWKELEVLARKIAAINSQVWVVTGPVFEYKGKKPAVFGSSKIALPTGFFKVMLYQSGDYSFNSFGFYMDNLKQDKPLAEYAVSVDKIEKMTGLDFFNLLPVEVQNIMEAKSSYKH
jgi:endonuclease G, mitochondrial